MLATKNYCDNDGDDDVQLNKMYKEDENQIYLLISPANFPTRKKTKNYRLKNIGDR